MLHARMPLQAGLLLFAAFPLCAQEHQTPWHVPIPAEGPKVGILVWADRDRFTAAFAPDRGLLVMPMLSYVGLFAQAGYRPTLLLPPAMVDEPRVKRGLDVCEYPTLALPLTGEADLRQFPLVVVPRVVRQVQAPGLAPLLDRYVKAGGKLIYAGIANGEDDACRQFLGVPSDQGARLPFVLTRIADHPLLAGLRFPLKPPRDVQAMAYRDGSKRGTPLLRFAGDGPPALSLWQDGAGQVAFLNIEMYRGGKASLDAEGFMLHDLILRTADWMTGAHPGGPRPTIKQRVERLKETDTLKPAGPEAVLLNATFERPDEMAAWSTWDEPGAEADSKIKNSDWWVDTQMGALIQGSGIYSYRGVGTRATVGKAEWSDYVVSTTIGTFGDDEFGIVFRFQDAGNYYRFMLDADTIVRVRIEKRQNGQLSQFVGVARPYIPRVPARYQIEARGNTFVVYTGGKELMRATDDAFKAGMAGIETSGSDIAVYDFQVFSLAAAPAATAPAAAAPAVPPATPASPGPPAQTLADWEQGEVPAIGIQAEKRADGKGSCGRLDVTRPFVRLTQVIADWSRAAEVSLWVRSERATGERVNLLLPSNDPATPGTDHYAVAFVVDWAGWRRLQWKPAEFRPSGRPVGWQQIDNLTLAGERWGKPGAAVLWIDDLALSGTAGPGQAQ